MANGKPEKLQSYIRKLHSVVNPKAAPRFGEIPYAPNQVMSLQVDITKLQKDTGFVPGYTFEEGIQEIYNWSKMELQFLGKENEFI